MLRLEPVTMALRPASGAIDTGASPPLKCTDNLTFTQEGQRHAADPLAGRARRGCPARPVLPQAYRTSPEEFARMVKPDIESFRRIVQAAGIKPE
jgi:hypothetical protein